MARIRSLLRAALVLVLAWQAGSAAWDLGARTVDRAAVGPVERLTLDGDERLRRATGPDAATVLALRAALPPRAIVLTREVRDMRESALLQRLRHTLYPTWVREVPAAVLAGPLRLPGDRPVFLLDLDPGATGPAPAPGFGAPRAVGDLRLFAREGG